LARPAVIREVRLLLPPKTLLPQVAAEETDIDDRHRFMDALQAGTHAEKAAALHGSSQQYCRCCGTCILTWAAENPCPTQHPGQRRTALATHSDAAHIKSESC
jgi:hypothetical protein